MKIASKIALGYILLVVLLAGVLVYEQGVIRDLQRRNTTLYKNYYLAGVETTRIRNDLDEIDANISRYFVTRDPIYTGLLLEWATTISSRLDRMLSYYGANGASAEFYRFEQSWKEFADRDLAVFTSSTADDERKVSEEMLLSRVEGMRNLARLLEDETQRETARQMELSEDVTQNAAKMVWIGGIFALLSGGILGLFVVRSIKDQIEELTAATREVARGDLRLQVSEHGRDEMSQLARHFNTMIRRLGEIDELKTGFVSRVSHELKGPMASIQETTSLLLDEIPGPLTPSQERLLKLNKESGGRLSRMIEELLQMSRLESGTERYTIDDLDIVELVRQVIREVEPISSKRGLEIELKCEHPVMNVECDSDKMIQVVRNLLENAAKFSPDGSTVEVDLDWTSQIPEGVPQSAQAVLTCPSGKFLLLRVRDRGPGVADSEKERVFEKFHQDGRARSLAGRGFGLGLAIAKHVVQAHAGAIWVGDRPEGGSDFQVLLCRRRVSGFSPPPSGTLPDR